MTTPTPECFEERLLERLKQIIAATPTLADAGASPFEHASRQGFGWSGGIRGVRWEPARRAWLRQRSARASVCALVAAVAAVVGLVVVPSFGGSQAGIAQAAVLRRAAAALEQPGTILYVQEQNYGSDAICFAGWAWSTMTKPLCLGGGAITPNQGISADPTQDTLNYSSQEWIDPNQSRDHTVYSNGDETFHNGTAQEYQVYDPANNTLTTLTGTPGPPGTAPPGSQTTPPASPLVIGPLGIAGEAVSDPTYFEQLYQEAQSGTQNTLGELSVTAQLLGQTTINGDSVYELSFDTHITPPTNLPAGDLCGATVCSPPDTQTLLYLDSQTFLPLRSVLVTVNSADRPGFPAGTTVRSVTDYTIQTLPDTPANETLLQMDAHPGATAVTETAQQNEARLKTLGRSILTHRRAEAKLARDRARGHAAVRDNRRQRAIHHTPPRD